MLAERVRAAREELGLTQAELADKLGVHVITVSRWERGTRRPAPEHISLIWQLTGWVLPEWFYRDDAA